MGILLLKTPCSLSFLCDFVVLSVIFLWYDKEQKYQKYHAVNAGMSKANTHKPIGPRFFDDVCRHYGDIIQDLPKDVSTGLRAFWHWVRINPLRWCLLKEKTLSHRCYHVIFAEFFSKHTHWPMTERTLLVLQSHGRMAYLPEILDYLTAIAHKGKTVYLKIASPMVEEDLTVLTQTLSHYWSCDVTIIPIDAPDLLLGGCLLWDSFMLDTSLRAVLNHLKKESIYVLASS